MSAWKSFLLFLLCISWLSSTPILLHSQPSFSNLNKYSRAVQIMGAKKYDQALDLFNSVQDEYYRYRAIAKIAEIYKIKNDLEALEADFQNILAQDSTQSENWYGLAQVAFQHGNYKKTISLIKASIHSGHENIQLIGLIAFSFGRLGKSPEMMAYFKNLVAKNGSHTPYLFGLGRAYNISGQFEKAAKIYDKLLSIDSTLTNALFWKWHTLAMRGKNDEFIDVGLEIYKRAKKQHDRERLIFVTHHLGMCYYGMADYETSLQYYDESLQYSQSLNLFVDEGRTLGNMIGIFARLRDPRALEYLPRAIELAEKTNQLDELQRFYMNSGVFYLNIGNPAKALEFYKKALAIADRIENKHLGYLASLHHNIGEIENDRGNSQQALSWMHKALDFAKRQLALTTRQSDEWAQADYFMGIGSVYVKMQDFEQATAYYQQAYHVYAKRAYPTAELGTYWNRTGYVYYLMGKDAEATNAYQKGSQIGQKIKLHSVIEQALNGLAFVEMRKNNNAEAIAHLQSVIAIIDSTRSILYSTALSSSFQESGLSAYKNLIALFAMMYASTENQAYTDSAFYYVERAKARALLDLLAQGRVFRNLQTIDKNLRQEFLVNTEQLEKKYTDLTKQLSVRTENQSVQHDAKIDALESKIATLQIKKQELLTQIERDTPAFSDLIHPPIYTIDRAQKMLMPGQALIEYFVTDSLAFVWVVRHDRHHFETIPAGRAWLQQRLKEISRNLFDKTKRDRDALQQNEVRNHRWANIQSTALQEFYREIFQKPVEKYLRDGDELIIIPDDLLFYFPFEMLVTEIAPSGSRYLIEKYPISYSPSTSAMAFTTKNNAPSLEQQKHPKGILAFANPEFEKQQGGLISYLGEKYAAIFRDDTFAPLPHSEKEAKAIAKEISNSSVYIGHDATEEKYKALAGQFRFIHFATHNLVNDQRPMFSRLVLARGSGEEDGFYNMYEIFNLQLQAELMVLSACNTGLGDFKRGEGLIGMSYAFRYAGVPSIVASLWQVEDATTAFLMQRFYRYLKQGLRKSVALQKAKIDLIQNAGTGSLRVAARNPYYWAPFILMGDSRPVSLPSVIIK